LGERGRLFSTARLFELGTRACADLTLYPGGAEADSEPLLLRARELLSRFDLAIAAAGRPIPLVLAARAGCIAEISRITNEDGIGAWREVQRHWERLGDSYLAAYARWRGAEACLAAGQRREAGDLFREAAATAAELGARPMLKELEALALRGRLEPAEGAAESESERALRRLELTARELEVLTLLAAGRTNREIAAELVISDKTASVHVSNILAKLGVRNRVEAASVAHTLGF
jgi:DNA-binding CsgD family transcriptional regulator